MNLLQNRNQLPILLKFLGLNGTGVEIGVASGDFSLCILENSNISHLVSIDPWSDKHDGFKDQNAADEAYNKTIERLSKFKERSRIIRDTAEVASNQIIDDSLDFVYIDSSHTYEATRKEIELYWPKLKVGGILAGHDYCNGPDIQRAVQELATSQDKEIFTTIDDYGIENFVVNSWIIRK